MIRLEGFDQMHQSQVLIVALSFLNAGRFLGGRLLLRERLILRASQIGRAIDPCDHPNDDQKYTAQHLDSSWYQASC
jgi:hypothetical protein